MKKLLAVLIYLICSTAAFAAVPGAVYMPTAGVNKVGTLPINCGGLNLTTAPTDGQLLIGKTSTNAYVLATLTAGSSKIGITNGSGSITLDVNQGNFTLSSIGGSVTGSQLPNPSASTLGGVESITAVSHNFLTSISTSGVPAQAQPAFSDISGTASLTSQVTGILPVANGGTNAATASAANVFAGPTSGSAAAPSFRPLVMTDLPGLFNQCRLYLVSGSPYADGSSSGNGTIYFGPCSNLGQYITLDNGSGVLSTYSISEISLSLASGFSSGTIYDVYAENSSGTISLDTAAWSGNTPPTRGTDAAGRLTKSSATNELLIGAIYMISSTKTADWTGERLDSNVYNTVPKTAQCTDTTADWLYTSATIRAANGNTTDGVGRVAILQVLPLSGQYITCFGSNDGNNIPTIGIGISSTTAFSSYSETSYQVNSGTSISKVSGYCSYVTTPTAGYQYFQRLEANGEGSGNAQFFGSTGFGSGLNGLTTVAQN